MPRYFADELPKEIQDLVNGFKTIKCNYEAAMREIKTKLEILDQEFEMQHSRNPIHHMESRLKTLESIYGKLQRKNLSFTLESAKDNLYDIAGIRVVCAYLNDIYTIANLLTSQDDVKLISVRDYIKEPKANGYRSLHLIVQIPVFFSSGKVLIPVEVQIRTIAMDFWASLEHNIRYKKEVIAPQKLNDALYDCANRIAELDGDMQDIHNQMVELVNSHIKNSN